MLWAVSRWNPRGCSINLSTSNLNSPQGILHMMSISSKRTVFCKTAGVPPSSCWNIAYRCWTSLTIIPSDYRYFEQAGGVLTCSVTVATYWVRATIVPAVYHNCIFILIKWKTLIGEICVAAARARQWAVCRVVTSQAFVSAACTTACCGWWPSDLNFGDGETRKSGHVSPRTANPYSVRLMNRLSRDFSRGSS